MLANMLSVLVGLGALYVVVLVAGTALGLYLLVRALPEIKDLLDEFRK